MTKEPLDRGGLLFALGEMFSAGAMLNKIMPMLQRAMRKTLQSIQHEYQPHNLKDTVSFLFPVRFRASLIFTVLYSSISYGQEC